VQATAYIRLPGTFGSRYKAVSLIPPNELIDIHTRYWDIADGNPAPGPMGQGACATIADTAKNV